LAVTRPLDGVAGDFTYPQHAAGGYAVMHAGALLHLRNTPRAGAAPLATAASRVNPVGLSTVDPHVLSPNEHIGRQFIYTEYSIPSGPNVTNRFAAYPSLYGGIAACSSQDLQHWRFEGFVLHYVNLSDTVFNTNMTLALERPKVIFNALTQQYVMWAVMDEPMRSLAQTMTATSPYEDGPFFFTRSFYPDGNQTRDQVVFVNDEGMPVLARTYYQTVEYLLPAAIMQPVRGRLRPLCCRLADVAHALPSLAFSLSRPLSLLSRRFGKASSTPTVPSTSATTSNAPSTTWATTTRTTSTCSGGARRTNRGPSSA
jgi:hypothetical protein